MQKLINEFRKVQNQEDELIYEENKIKLKNK
jgi:hypothetical protein